MFVSTLCSQLNPHLPEGRKLDPSAPTNSLLDTIQSLSDEGQFPDDKIMDDMLADCQENDTSETRYLKHNDHRG